MFYKKAVLKNVRTALKQLYKHLQMVVSKTMKYMKLLNTKRFPCEADVVGTCRVLLRLSVCFKTFSPSKKQKTNSNFPI